MFHLNQLLQMLFWENAANFHIILIEFLKFQKNNEAIANLISPQYEHDIKCVRRS